jgi:hypothetical protein
MSDVTIADPFGSPDEPTRLTDVSPEGYRIEIDDDGSMRAVSPRDIRAQQVASAGHYDNLALHIDEQQLDEICRDLLDAIEQDKQSREKRDKQYAEGLDRCGMGDNIQGGADFPGASRAVHPALLESAIDFGGRVMNELLPPEGPVKAAIVGDETDEKNAKAKRIARYMNWQLTELMPAAYHEFEVGLTQCSLAGGFYTKTYEENGVPAVVFVPIDKVYRPYSDGDFYSQPRITHAQPTDRLEYRANVASGLWRDVLSIPLKGGQTPPELTRSEESTNRIIGKEEPIENVDGTREIYEVSVVMGMPTPDDEVLPYLVTLDKEQRKVLSIYRNWRESDKKRQRIDFLVEWPFWPWRGGYPIGMTHMIGQLSGAATGTLRALLDAGLLNNSQTGVSVKGGSTSGGQNITPRVTEITELKGSMSQDDVRKTFMPFKFNEPSPTLFQLLGFLVDAARGVVRTTFDEYDKFNGQTPVGTAQMFIEQGLSNFGSVHGRLHRSMRRFLKGLYQINQDTLNDQTIVDQQGELTVSAQDFAGPMVIIPVSDPRIFTDMQRKTQAQMLAERATVAPELYVRRATEENLLTKFNIPNPEKYLIPNPQPQQMNMVAENVTASQGNPIKAYPGQDHESHIRGHVAYLKSPIFGQNFSIAPKLIPVMIGHLGEHLALWYSDAMLEAATAAIRMTSKNPELTLQSFMAQGLEAPLDRMMDQLDDKVLELALQKLEDVPDVIMEARDLLKTLAPPMPMDPSLVAQDDVQRQREADKKKSKTDVLKLVFDREKSTRADMLKARDQDLKSEEKAAELAARQETERRNAALAAVRDEETAEAAERGDETKLTIARESQDTQVEIAEMNNESREDIAETSAEATAKAAAARPKTASGGD